MFYDDWLENRMLGRDVAWQACQGMPYLGCFGAVGMGMACVCLVWTIQTLSDITSFAPYHHFAPEFALSWPWWRNGDVWCLAFGLVETWARRGTVFIFEQCQPLHYIALRMCMSPMTTYLRQTATKYKFCVRLSDSDDDILSSTAHFTRANFFAIFAIS